MRTTDIIHRDIHADFSGDSDLMIIHREIKIIRESPIQSLRISAWHARDSPTPLYSIRQIVAYSFARLSLLDGSDRRIEIQSWTQYYSVRVIWILRSEWIVPVEYDPWTNCVKK